MIPFKSNTGRNWYLAGKYKHTFGKLDWFTKFFIKTAIYLPEGRILEI